jgi:hypothetical protein
MSDIVNEENVQTIRLGLASKSASAVISYTPSEFLLKSGFLRMVFWSSIFRSIVVREEDCCSTSGSTMLSNQAEINWSGAFEKAVGSVASTLVRI